MDAHATAAPQTGHDSPLGLYLKVYVALMVLLVLTVGVAYLNIGAWSLPVALTIAAIKAVVVVIYFMHMRFTGKLMWVYISASVVWLGMLLFGVLIDVIMRTR